MYRFLAKPKWIVFTVSIAALMVTMIELGFWQIRRLHQRQTFNAQVIARSQVPPVDATIVDLEDVATRDWASVRATGTFEQVTAAVVVSGGWQIVSPLTLDNGSTILVVRGFTTAERDRPAPPSGRLTIDGILRSSPKPTTRPTVDGAAHRLVLQSAKTDGDLTPIAPVALDEGPHLSYAIQWFFFTLCAATGWVLVVRRQTRPARTSGQGGKPFDRNQAVPWQTPSSPPRQQPGTTEA
jgi:cytochrome oxidase assembly protein ShyY1